MIYPSAVAAKKKLCRCQLRPLQTQPPRKPQCVCTYMHTRAPMAGCGSGRWCQDGAFPVGCSVSTIRRPAPRELLRAALVAPNTRCILRQGCRGFSQGEGWGKAFPLAERSLRQRGVFCRASTGCITVKSHQAACGRGFFCISFISLLTVKAVG